jgi:predicted dehydrogenase
LSYSLLIEMNENQNSDADFSRRDFLRSGSAATIMAMMGGVELIAQTAPGADEAKASVPRIKIGVIGLGAWGREIISTLNSPDPAIPSADVAAICDTYQPFLNRAAKLAPSAEKITDYKAILDNKDIKAVIVATPTHKHKDIVIAALQAGKHVYCEAPMAHTIEDARAIALAAKAASDFQVFQVGLQMRSHPQTPFLLKFIRSGCLGKNAMARAQWHKKQSWRAASPNPEREKELNWRLDKSLSLGLAGEVGIHQLDQALQFLNGQPLAVTGWGSVLLWTEDGREVPDTIQAVFEFPAKVNMIYDASLANSFDDHYEIFYGSDAAIMLRDEKAWMFKEVDSPLLGWEVYARKDTFYKETGIALMADASKAVVPTGTAGKPPAEKTPLFCSLNAFVLNASQIASETSDYIEISGADDRKGLAEHLSKIQRRPGAGYLEGYQSAVLAVKTNEAIMSRTRLELKPEWYALT